MAGFAARSKLRQAAFELIDGFRSASGKISTAARAKPGAYTVPAAFVGSITERAIGRDAQLEHRTPTADVWFIFGAQDNETTADLQDACIDAFIEYVDARADQADPATVLELVSTDDQDLTLNSSQGSVTYVATKCVLSLDVWEGRQ